MPDLDDLLTEEELRECIQALYVALRNSDIRSTESQTITSAIKKLKRRQTNGQ